MAVFTIQAPDGRKLDIEAADEQTAIRGAQEWVTANPAQSADPYGDALKAASSASQFGTGPVTPRGSTGEQSQNVQGLDPQGAYDFALNRVRQQYFPTATDEQWAQIAKEYGPYDAGQLLNSGLTLGLNADVAGAGQALGAMTRGADFGRAFGDFSQLERQRQKLGAAQQGGLGVAAEVAGTVLSGRPDMAAGRVAGLIPTMLDGAKSGAVTGGIYGFGSTDGSLDERLQGAATGALIGGGTGAAVPAVIAGGKRVLSPSGALPAATTRANTILRNEGVEITAGQATGNRNLRYREAELGGRAAEDFTSRQGEQFTAAALRRVGVNAPRATHDVIDSTFSAIGQQFDDLAARNFIQPDQRLARDIQGAWRRFEGSTNPSTRPRVIERIIHDIYGGPSQRMTGGWYKATRSELGRLSKSQNPELAEAARDLQTALDDAMQRTIQQYNPGDAGAWQEVRRLYRNMLVIEDAATRAGAQSADGIITPASLRSAAMRHNKRAFARGQNDFTDLADAGVSAMTPLPDSGTPGRLNAKSALPIGAATGAGIGGTVGGIPGAIIGGVAGAAVPWAIGRTLLSGPGRAYLSNQLAAQPVGSLAALIGSMAGRGEQPLLTGR